MLNLVFFVLYAYLLDMAYDMSKNSANKINFRDYVGRSAVILGKDKVMSTLKKCFAVLNSQPNTKLLTFLDWLALLVRQSKLSF